MNEVALKVYMNCLRCILFALSLTLIACTDPMLGKKLPIGNYPQFSNGTNGHHQVAFERGMAKLEYDWHINNDANTLTFDGVCYIYTADWKAFGASSDKDGSMAVSAYILNKNYEVVEVVSFFFPFGPETPVKEKTKINKTIPYNGDYKFVTYRIWYEGRH